jgi:DNA-binding response OmpR family regulator
VDDEPYILDLVTTLLEDEGYDVLRAVDAREAYRLAQAEMPDLVLSDLSMPGDSGFDLYRWLTRSRPVPRMIFMSAVSRPPVTSVPFLEKPFDIDDLLDAVSGELAQIDESA